MVSVGILFKHVKVISIVQVGLFSLNCVPQQAELEQRAHSLNRAATRQVLHVGIIGGWRLRHFCLLWLLLLEKIGFRVLIQAILVLASIPVILAKLTAGPHGDGPVKAFNLLHLSRVRFLPLLHLLLEMIVLHFDFFTLGVAHIFNPFSPFILILSLFHGDNIG